MLEVLPLKDADASKVVGPKVPKKARKRVEAGGGTVSEIRLLLGPSVCVELASRVEAHMRAGQTMLKPQDFAAYVKYVLLGHTRPPFVVAKHLALCQHVLVLAFDDAHAESFAQAYAPRLATPIEVPMRLWEAYQDRPGGVRSLLFVKAGTEDDTTEAGSEEPASLESLLSSREDMREAGYPEAHLATALDGAAALLEGHRLFALDAEMVEVADGSSALARVSLVDDSSRVLYDELVLPEAEITDYRTQWSGITPQSLEGVTLTAEDARSAIRAIVRPSDVLVGHSLENDLRALGLAHSRVVCTAQIFPHPLGGGRKRKLAALVSELLGDSIQGAQPNRRGAAAQGGLQGGQIALGHDSVEDARACMRLVLARLRNRQFGLKRRRLFQTLPEVLGETSARIRSVVIDSGVSGGASVEERLLAHLRPFQAPHQREGGLGQPPSPGCGEAGGATGTPALKAFTWLAGPRTRAEVETALDSCPANTLLVALVPSAPAVIGECSSAAKSCMATFAVVTRPPGPQPEGVGLGQA